MFIILDKNKNKIKQTINKNYGISTKEYESLIEITNKSLMDKISKAYEYNLIFDDNDKLIDLTIIKTMEEYIQEQKSNADFVEEIIDEEKVAMAEAIVNLTMELEEIKTQIGGIL